MKTKTNVKKKTEGDANTSMFKPAKSAAALAIESALPTDDVGTGKGLNIAIPETPEENEILKKDTSVFAPIKEKAKKCYDDGRYSNYLAVGYALGWELLAKVNDPVYFAVELSGFSRKSPRAEHLGALKRTWQVNPDSYAARLTRAAKTMEYVENNLELEFTLENYDEKAIEVADYIKDNGGIHGCASKLDVDEGTYTTTTTSDKLTPEQVKEFAQELKDGCTSKGNFELTNTFPTPESELVAMIGHKKKNSIDIVLIATNPKAVELVMNNLDK
ncbi:MULTISPECIES: hypothetical protein [Colwellia]|uniref:Uncharacterized protein n=1 Tax=Colwellia marinimaniae TaxID=1513592 RepID=A0ABQ0MWC1_9GAMM|nr:MULTISPECIES: hypothetical protein [Colwellia]GAW96678.1 hypothetical protein MTCD1_02298 [Colwellia marinimaniae]